MKLQSNREINDSAYRKWYVTDESGNHIGDIHATKNSLKKNGEKIRYFWEFVAYYRPNGKESEAVGVKELESHKDCMSWLQRKVQEQSQEKAFRVAFCGIDGAGKTTLINLLAAQYRKEGSKVALYNEPHGEDWRTQLKEHLQKGGNRAEWFVQNRAAAQPHLEELVSQNDYVFQSRGILDTFAYADEGEHPRLYELNKEFPKPDMIIYLDLPPVEAIARIRARGEDDLQVTEEELQVVYDRFEALISAGLQPFFTRNFFRVDANQSLGQVCRKVTNYIERCQQFEF